MDWGCGTDGWHQCADNFRTRCRVVTLTEQALYVGLEADDLGVRIGRRETSNSSGNPFANCISTICSDSEDSWQMRSSCFQSATCRRQMGCLLFPLCVCLGRLPSTLFSVGKLMTSGSRVYPGTLVVKWLMPHSSCPAERPCGTGSDTYVTSRGATFQKSDGTVGRDAPLA